MDSLEQYITQGLIILLWRRLMVIFLTGLEVTAYYVADIHFCWLVIPGHQKA